jgi:hypothetical protein
LQAEAEMKLTGWILTVVSVLFLLMDGGMKLGGVRASMEATMALGFTAGQVRALGAILLASTLLYAAPLTSILGAILITAYLGGAVAINLQHNTPVASHLLFGVYIGGLVWAALFLRSETLRSMLPIARGLY